jgi:SPP1 family predicted phage head-tail adaptor
MNPGRKDEQVVIQSRTLSTDRIGGAVETWATYATIWAMVRDASGGDGQKADSNAVVNLFEVTAYYDSTVSAEAHRILWGSRVLEILGTPRRLGRADMVISCAERRVP